MSGYAFFSSESVTEGHPDQLCDQISDAIIDRFLQQDPYAEVNAECAVAKGIVFIATRFASSVTLDVTEVARSIITEIGYRRIDFDGRTCSVVTSLNESPLVDSHRFEPDDLTESEIEQVAAANQASVFGFACRQTNVLMPLPIWLAHKLTRRLTTARLGGILPYLRPDGKTFVGVEYQDRQPSRIHTIVISTQYHLPAGEPNAVKRLEGDILEHIIHPVFQDEPLQPDRETRIFINPEGEFTVGGPARDTGLTGRKIMVDTYGGYAHHGGSAISGKDLMNVGRSGVYAARYAAKNLVAAEIAEECEVHLSYAIGKSRPISIDIDTFNTGRYPDEKIREVVTELFDFRPAAILRQFRLRHLPAIRRDGFYRKIAAYGQVGRMDIGLPWERTDRVDDLKKAF